ncbi:hypothetical protein Hanom_Chr03g00218951 [Helianthus anomalus]
MVLVVGVTPSSRFRTVHFWFKFWFTLMLRLLWFSCGLNLVDFGVTQVNNRLSMVNSQRSGLGSDSGSTHLTGQLNSVNTVEPSQLSWLGQLSQPTRHIDTKDLVKIMTRS